MPLYFTKNEYAERHNTVLCHMSEQGLDGILVFLQENMFYLTGYDTAGYSMFQCMILTVDGRIGILTRSADLRQARVTSFVDDVRIWRDAEGANPATDLRDMLASYGFAGKRLGIEYHAYCLTAQRGKAVDAALEGFCTLVDASDLIRKVRLVKSDSELSYVRQAGTLLDAATECARKLVAPGVSLAKVFGAMTDVILSGDGDPSASRWPLGAGENALLARYRTGHGTIGCDDQIMFEPGAAYRHYHAAAMYTFVTGRLMPEQQRMYDACWEALENCKGAARPGNTLGEVFDQHVTTFKKRGYDGHFLNACGYPLGISYPPTWMDFPMVVSGSREILREGMVFFIHMILFNSDMGLAMALGETILVTPSGHEQISHAPSSLVHIP